MANAVLKEHQSAIKQKLMDFVAAHPRLISLLAGFGISFTFTLVTQPVILHEIIQPAYAFIPGDCQACGASEFAPGQEQVLPGGAEEFAPGHGDKEFDSPGLEGLDAGIIGPPKKLPK